MLSWRGRKTWMAGTSPAMTRYRCNATRLPLCAEPERLSASRPRLFGVAEFRSGACKPAAASCCASRTSTPTRCKPEFETAIYEDLAWLGLAWEKPVRRQSEHLRRISRCARKALGPRVWSIRVSKAAPRLPDWWRSGRRRRHGRATPTARRSIPARRKLLPPDERARLLASGAPYALRLDMAAACARAGDLELDRARRGSRGRDRHGRRPARSVGRRHPGAQGDADQLSPLGGDRRRLAGRDGGGAGPGSVLVDQRPSAAAAAARSAAAGLPASPPHPRWRWAKTVEIDRRLPACANSAPGAQRRPTSAAWSACLNCEPLPGLLRRDRREKTRLRRDSRGLAMAWWGRPGRGNHGAKIALTAQHAVAEKAAAEKTRRGRCRRQGAQARRQ